MNVTCEQSGDVVIVHAGPARLMHPSLSEFSTLVTGEIARRRDKLDCNVRSDCRNTHSLSCMNPLLSECQK